MQRSRHRRLVPLSSAIRRAASSTTVNIIISARALAGAAHEQQLPQLGVEGVQQAVPLPQLGPQVVPGQRRRRQLHLQHGGPLATGQVRDGQSQPCTRRGDVGG